MKTSTSFSRASFSFTSSLNVFSRARSFACSSPFSVRICSEAFFCSARCVSVDWISARRSAASASIGASASVAWPPRAASRFFTSSRFATTNRRSSMGHASSPRFFLRQSLRVRAVQSDATDAELLEAFRRGDTRAFETLVRRYQRAVLAIARRFARDEDDAEDLAQRAFINASERAGGWRGGSFKSWLFRIVVNLAKNHLRDIARFDRSETEHEPEPSAPEAHDRLEAREQRKALREAVARLPRRQREVLLLRVDGDIAFAEIAQTLGITEVNAKVNSHHAVQKLKDWVKPQG